MDINLGVIKEIAERHNLGLVYLFGSFVDKTFSDGSDIDFAFLSEDGKPLSYDNYMALQKDFGLSLSSMGREIQLVDLGKVNSLLGFEVARTGKLLYGESKGDFEFYNRAVKKFCDEKKLRDNLKDYVMSA